MNFEKISLGLPDPRREPATTTPRLPNMRRPGPVGEYVCKKQDHNMRGFDDCELF